MRNILLTGIVFSFFAGLAAGQTYAPMSLAVLSGRASDDAAVVDTRAPLLSEPAPLPRMAPELALQAYHGRAIIQAQQLAGYSAVTIIHAELPDTSQFGEYELERHYAAPHNLQFTAVRYIGDGFVKTNVIGRLLQSEVDHVKQDDGALTAINNKNYKFSYKGSSQIDGRVCHVFQVKPHKKRPGLFKGKIYLDAYTGSLVRTEGAIVKSPSFFIKKVEFIQDYVDVGNFTFPLHVHSDARARVIGRTVVDIYHRAYQPVTAIVQTASQGSSSAVVSSQ
ncbi:MAG TPA: hypothetical protein VGF08_08475 [Terriglobales bacterium]